MRASLSREAESKRVMSTSQRKALVIWMLLYLAPLGVHSVDPSINSDHVEQDWLVTDLDHHEVGSSPSEKQSQGKLKLDRPDMRLIIS